MKVSFYFLVTVATLSAYASAERVVVEGSTEPIHVTAEAEPQVANIAGQNATVPVITKTSLPSRIWSFAKRHPVKTVVATAGTAYVAKSGYDANQRVKRYRHRKARLATARPEGPTHKKFPTYMEDDEGEREYVTGMDETTLHLDALIEKMFETSPRFAGARKWFIEAYAQKIREMPIAEQIRFRQTLIQHMRMDPNMEIIFQQFFGPMFEEGFKGFDKPFMHEADIEAESVFTKMGGVPINNMTREEVLEKMGRTEADIEEAGGMNPFCRKFLIDHHPDKVSSSDMDMDEAKRLTKQLKAVSK